MKLISLLEMLGLPATLLGVDVVKDRRLVMSDANEQKLLELLHGEARGKAHIIVTVIGGQGYIFGRGNQQLSAEVLEAAGFKNITVIATESKMIALEGKPLLVDTGVEDVNRALCGYKMVKTAQGKTMVYKVSC